MSSRQFFLAGMKVARKYHPFILDEPAQANRIEAFEIRHRLGLPSGYREFITQLGDGGCSGPSLGLHSLTGTNSLPAELKQDGNLLVIGQNYLTYACLRLTGDQAGTVFLEDQLQDSPEPHERGLFLDWYEDWIDKEARGLSRKRNLKPAKEPADPVAHLAYAFTRKPWETVAEIGRAALEQLENGPTKPHSKTYEDVLSNLGAAYTFLGQEAGIPILEKLIARGSNRFHYANIALIKHKLGRHEEALASSEKGDDGFYNLTVRGQILSALGRLQEAVAAFEQAVERNHQHGTANIGLGNAYRDLCRHRDAERAYRNAINHGSGGLELGYYRLAALYVEEGKLNQARQCLSEAGDKAAEAHDDPEFAPLFAKRE